MSDDTVSIAALPFPDCPLCRAAGTTLYENLQDFVFGVSGRWRLARCQQADCGLLWLDPQPTPADLPKAYAKYYTHENASPAHRGSKSLPRRLYHALREAWWQQALGYQPGGRRWWRQLLAPVAFAHPCGTDAISVEAMFLKAPASPGRLLEIGCGNGHLLERAKSLGWKVEGVDFDPVCVELVKERNIPCHLGDLREVNYSPVSFDAIYTGNVIEHVYDPVGFVTECFRVLRPGGRLVIVTPNSRSTGHACFQRDWRGLEPPRHLQIFHSDNLRTLLQKCGFASTEVRTTNRGAYYFLEKSAGIRATRMRGDGLDRKPIHLLSPATFLRQQAARWRLLQQPDSGEEVIAIGTKA